MQKIGPETFSGPAERWEKPAGWEQAAICISMAFSASTHILTGKFSEMKMVNIFVVVFHQIWRKNCFRWAGEILMFSALKDFVRNR